MGFFGEKVIFLGKYISEEIYGCRMEEGESCVWE